MLTESKWDQYLVSVISLALGTISFMLGFNGLGILLLLAFLLLFKPTRYVIQYFNEVVLGFLLISFVIFIVMIALVYFFT